MLVIGSRNKGGFTDWWIIIEGYFIIVKHYPSQKQSSQKADLCEAFRILSIKAWQNIGVIFFTYHGLFAILYFRRFYTILHFPKPCIAAHKNSNYPKGIKLCKECEYFVMEGGDPRLYLFRVLNKAEAVGVTSGYQYYAELLKIFFILSAGLVSSP